MKKRLSTSLLVVASLCVATAAAAFLAPASGIIRVAGTQGVSVMSGSRVIAAGSRPINSFDSILLTANGTRAANLAIRPQSGLAALDTALSTSTFKSATAAIMAVAGVDILLPPLLNAHQKWRNSSFSDPSLVPVGRRPNGLSLIWNPEVENDSLEVPSSFIGSSSAKRDSSGLLIKHEAEYGSFNLGDPTHLHWYFKSEGAASTSCGGGPGILRLSNLFQGGVNYISCKVELSKIPEGKLNEFLNFTNPDEPIFPEIGTPAFQELGAIIADVFTDAETGNITKVFDDPATPEIDLPDIFYPVMEPTADVNEVLVVPGYDYTTTVQTVETEADTGTQTSTETATQTLTGTISEAGEVALSLPEVLNVNVTNFGDVPPPADDLPSAPLSINADDLPIIGEGSKWLPDVCPQPVTFTIPFFGDHTLSWHVVCQYAWFLKIFVMCCGAWSALVIVAGTGGRN